MPDSTDQRVSCGDLGADATDSSDADTDAPIPVAPVSESPDPQAIDPRAIDSVLRIGGNALLERLVDVAEGNVRERLRQIEAALAAAPPDTVAVERSAHSIKSSAAYLGAEALRRHAEQMELDAGRGRTSGLAARAEEAGRLFELVLPALAEEVRRRK